METAQICVHCLLHSFLMPVFTFLTLTSVVDPITNFGVVVCWCSGAKEQPGRGGGGQDSERNPRDRGAAQLSDQPTGGGAPKVQ